MPYTRCSLCPSIAGHICPACRGFSLECDDCGYQFRPDDVAEDDTCPICAEDRAQVSGADATACLEDNDL